MVQLNEIKDNIWIVRWINLCARLHKYVMDQNDDWTAEDAGDDIPIVTDEGT